LPSKKEMHAMAHFIGYATFFKNRLWGKDSPGITDSSYINGFYRHGILLYFIISAAFHNDNIG